MLKVSSFAIQYRPSFGREVNIIDLESSKRLLKLLNFSMNYIKKEFD